MLVWAVVVTVAVLAHTAPFRFLFDLTDQSVWRMPKTDPPTIYLTFDDGPNPAATADVLDVLQRHGVKGTFFVIDEHLTGVTAPLVRRAFDEGHGVALHSGNRWLMVKTPGDLASTLEAAADRMEQLTGRRPCHAFRPHGGNRSIPMLMGAARAGYTLVGWGWLLWDFNWFRKRTADDIVPRLVSQASPGDIMVIHDGHHADPAPDRRYAIETVDRLIPELKAKGFEFGTICPG